jgi:hypothetical protein
VDAFFHGVPLSWFGFGSHTKKFGALSRVIKNRLCHALILQRHIDFLQRLKVHGDFLKNSPRLAGAKNKLMPKNLL